jgi:S1-C subfamily serine protease
MTAVEELSSALAETVARTSPAVVGVGRGGSGLVVGEGQVVTNAHNLRGEEVTVSFADGRRATGTPAGVDLDGDLAVVSVDTGGVAAPGFSTSPARPGQLVVALADPGGRGLRASLGMVSAVDVPFRGPGGRVVPGAIEHTAPLARGSSGGPVVDAGGAVLGIDTHRIGDGFYLALPADAELRARLDGLARGEVPQRPRLGIAVAPPQVAQRLRRSVGLPERAGLLVRGVDEAGPAGAAGIRHGDLIVRVAGTDVAGIDDLAAALSAAGAGASVQVDLVRGAEELTVTVPLPAAD